MKLRIKKILENSIVMYVFATIVALISVASLVNNVLLFKNTVAQYIAEGYPSNLVYKQLIPSQLLPGIFEPIAIYGGIAFILCGFGMINQKVSKCLKTLDKVEANAVNIDTPEQSAVAEEISEVTNETQHSLEI